MVMMKCFSFPRREERQVSDQPTEALKCGSSSTSTTTDGTTTATTPADLSIKTRKSSSDQSLFSSSQSTRLLLLSPRNSIHLSSPQTGSNTLRVFTFEELKVSTKSFSRSLMIGEGGFGCVYKGVLESREGDSDKKIDIAVKQLSRRGLQGHKEWITEVNVLGVVSHPNLVKLMGYCADDDERGIQRLLVYEYMPNRSVLDHLCSRSKAPLPWSTRLKIAQDSAGGLAYLHHGMDFQIIFRDFKSSNILLDQEWNAKLSDFGLARLGPLDESTHVSTTVVGTIGYAAPEYLQTGRLTYKCDVYSYGVFLYELMTGRRPFDLSRPKDQQNLIDWVRPQMISNEEDTRRFEELMDPRLGSDYSLKSARLLARVANKCLERSPKARPRMTQVFQMVSSIVEELGFETPGYWELSPMVDVDEPGEESERYRMLRTKTKRIVNQIVGDRRWLVWCSKGSA